MSGLWSFRDATVPLPCLSDAARASLPAAAVDDDLTYNVAVEENNILLGSPVKVFSSVTDVDGVIKEVQNEWLNRIVGHVPASPYHLRLDTQETLSKLDPPLGKGLSPIEECEPLGSEDMAFLGNLLNKQVACIKKKINICVRQRCLTVSTPPVLRSAGLICRRGKQQVVGKENGGGETKTALQKPNDCADDIFIQKDANSSLWEYGAKGVHSKKRSIPQLSSCAFVDNMERRAAQRRAARLALGASRAHNVASAEFSTTKDMGVSSRSKTRPTLLYDRLPLEMQVALISLDRSYGAGGEVNRLCQYEAIAQRWRFVRLKKRSWECWRRAQHTRLDKRKYDATKFVKSGTLVTSSLVQIDRRLTRVVPSHAPLLAFGTNTYTLLLLRWYFVLWVAFVEAARDKCAAMRRAS